MSNQTLQILSKLSKKDKYNILTFATHERYESDLCLTGHNFYCFDHNKGKKWDENYAKIPSNYHILPQNTIPQGLDLDFILAQSKFGQLQIAFDISKTFRLPIICMEHTVPTPNMTNEQVNYLKSIKGHLNVFNTEYNKDVWGFFSDGIVAPHNVDSETFCSSEEKRDNVVLSVANDFINRDYCLNFSGWQRITKGLPVKVIGNTPGLSEAASSVQELVKGYQSSSVFLNTSTFSPLPTALLEAMSCGCAIVSTATCEIPKIIEHGKNGFISNDEQELRGYVEQLLNNPEMAVEMGKAARSTVLSRFTTENFTEKWNTIFNQIYQSSIL